MKKAIAFLVLLIWVCNYTKANQTWIEKANEFYEKSAFDSSAYYFSKLIDLYPDSVQLYYNRGLANYGANNFKESISDFSKVIKNNPEDVKALEWRAKLNLEQNKWNAALADFEAAFELTGNSEIKQKIRLCHLNYWLANYWLYMLIIIVAFIVWIVFLVKAVKSK